MSGSLQGFQASNKVQSERTSISSVGGDFTSCNQRLMAYLEKLQQLVYKLEGPKPTPVSPAVDRPPHQIDHIIGALDEARMTYSRLLDEMERLLGNLENAL